MPFTSRHAGVKAGLPAVRVLPEIRRHRYWTSWTLAVVAFMPCGLVQGDAAASDAYAIRNATIASGGGSAPVGSLRLIGTIGEPVMGTTSAGAFRLTAGFPATLPDEPANTIDGDIFSDSFEGTGG